MRDGFRDQNKKDGFRMRTVLAHCGTSSTEHTKAKAFPTVREARAFAQSHDPEDLNFVVVTIHLAKEDLCSEAWSRLLDDTFATDSIGSWEVSCRHVEGSRES